MENVDTHQEDTSADGQRINVYELGYLLAPTIAEEQLPGEVQNIKSVLDKFEVVTITEDFPKLRPLAYTMVKATTGQRNKFDKAYFGWIKFEASSNAIPLIKTELDKNGHIVRSLVIGTVRESTLATQRVPFRPGAEGDKAKKPDELAADQPKATQEELDKSIDSLIVE